MSSNSVTTIRAVEIAHDCQITTIIGLLDNNDGQFKSR